MCAIHPVFHDSQLELAIPNTIPDQIQPPLPLVEVDGECYDHVQLQVLSSHSGHIVALQLDSGHSPLTPVMFMQITFR